MTKGKNRKSSEASKVRTLSNNSSFDQELPSTSKEPSPALSTATGDGETGSASGSSHSELSDRKKAITAKDQLSFFSGNPFVEKVQGILHFYKENHMTSLDMDVPRSQMICMLAIPAWLSCHDLLNFLAPCCPGIRRVRIIRDKTPNQYMALVLFRSQEEADECYKTFNGTPYNSIESEHCHIVYVAKVDICGDTTVGGGGFGPPMTGMTELPICTVCLERMDESVDGILTILCNHSFHGACLAKWGDTTCPVCRYLQSPEMAAESCCSECKSNESLWICLICGHVGCGRYVEGHAYHHFLETQHCYAMQLGNTRVWDYVGDNFVHRLLQNNEDGKLVEVEGNSSGNNMEHEEKLDSVQLEYLYLLQSQLASQKIHFEGIIDRLEQQHRQEREEIKEKVKSTVKENERLKVKEKKVTQISFQSWHPTKLTKAIADLQEEKELNRSLTHNQSSWHQRVAQLETQVQKIREEKETSVRELQEQLQDVMLYFEAQEKFKNTELEGGQVVLGMPQSPSRSSLDGSKGARNKKRGK
ncbi:hypothetical protein DAPPUDRAFT_47474 [Daphnia pulex]|uniref:BRCA1-associated protein n=1 Tax=Daphnia pulex TaxID=6669 RepID=E9G8M1_DAPPU|nr:hypothetical protein DAPPUDRAFT_47474 [Daphnia pulex]|eukprot:EFX84242.1 hypothetical protein DAPPUDRAFT_47474 [Daphnia pulex]